MMHSVPVMEGTSKEPHPEGHFAQLPLLLIGCLLLC
jgi:hypothetical protein